MGVKLGIFTFREEHRLRVHEKEVQKEAFGHERDLGSNDSSPHSDTLFV
jgi:hypothetical protein